MGQELARVPREQRSISNSCGVSCTGSPPTVTDRFSRSTRSSPISTTGSVGWAGAAQRRPQPGQQLVDPERLRHVVVGAGVERGDLLALVADRREHDHGASLHVRSSRQTSVPCRRQDEIEDDRVGRPQAASASASSAVAAVSTS